MTKWGKCKVCKRIDICEWCDDHERRVCVFCMDAEHRALWHDRVKELQGRADRQPVYAYFPSVWGVSQVVDKGSAKPADRKQEE